MGQNMIIRRIDKKYLFGFEYYKQGDFYYPYSDIEKTFIDMVYFKVRLSDDVLGEMRRRIDKKKLQRYLEKYPLRIRKIVVKSLGK